MSSDGQGAGDVAVLDAQAADPAAEAGRSEEELSAALAALHDRLTLRDVRTQRLVAEVFGDLPLAIAKINIHVSDPEVLVEPPRFSVRFTQRLVLLDEADGTLALVEVAVVVEFELDGEQAPDDDAVALYAEHNAYFIAHPYLRETVQSTTSRIGLDPLVLGVLSRDERRPTEVTLVPRRPS